jgi:hypothetical protein
LGCDIISHNDRCVLIYIGAKIFNFLIRVG